MARKQPPRPSREIEDSTGEDGAVHLGRDYLAYVRERLSPPALKRELEARLIPHVRLDGPPPAPGRSFGKFKIEATIGRGGMAEVWLARDPELKAPVALKVMNDELSKKPDYVRRFLREAANHALVESENVVGVLELGVVNGRVYFTMELVEGETLRDHMNPGPLDEKEGVEILGQVAAGLLAAHERGVGHRDLKPSNIMLAKASARYGFELGDEGDVVAKIMDFGLARMIADDSDPDLEADGRILGTAKYVAPELLMTGKATLKSDIWALGVIAYQMFSGRPPFAAKHKEEYLEAAVRVEAPPLDQVAPVSKDLARVVALMLAKDPSKRPDAEALVRDFERLKKRRGEEPLAVSDDVTSAFYTVSSGAPPPRGKAPLAIGAVLACVVLLGVLVIATRPKPPPPPPAIEPPPPGAPPFLPGNPNPPPSPPPSVEPTHLAAALGTAPPPLATPLPARFKDRLARDEFRRAVDEGDRAWAAGDPEVALARWKAAASRLKDTPEPDLEARIDRASLEAALARAKAAAVAGDLKGELAALEEAAERDPEVAKRVETLRARLRAIDELDKGLAAADELGRKGEQERAIERLEALRPAARELEREKEVLDRASALQAKLAAVRGRGRALELLARSRKFLDEGALDTAAQAFEQARTLSPDLPEVTAFGKVLAQVKATPDGMVWLEVEPGVRALYARRAAVTNRDYNAWFAAQAGRVRPPSGWPAGSYPESKADELVRGVRLDDARAFAAARGERLPSELERPVLERKLAAPATESVPDARGLLSSFRTVRDAGGPP